MNKEKVLFVCIHNSARSQIAEALLNSISGDKFEVKSAGIKPGKLNPLAVESLKELGIDITGKAPKDVFDFVKSGEMFSYVITVCDETSGERCPLFPGVAKRLHWNFRDPSSLQGTYEEKLKETNRIRDEIKEKIKEWVLSLES